MLSPMYCRTGQPASSTSWFSFLDSLQTSDQHIVKVMVADALSRPPTPLSGMSKTLVAATKPPILQTAIPNLLSMTALLTSLNSLQPRPFLQQQQRHWTCQTTLPSHWTLSPCSGLAVLFLHSLHACFLPSFQVGYCPVSANHLFGDISSGVPVNSCPFCVLSVQNVHKPKIRTTHLHGISSILLALYGTYHHCHCFFLYRLPARKSQLPCVPRA
jgi:hypothetical protein